MASEPVKIRTLAGVPLEVGQLKVDSSGNPEDIGIPLQPMVLACAVYQLQQTVNELIVRVNALAEATTHTADKVTGEGQAASNLFTAA